MIIGWPLLAGGVAAAAESTVTHARVQPPFAEYMESWHDFYLLAGTAAVTLAGLLFVALSLHLDRLVEESHEHLLALTRSTLLSFVLMLTASLMMLTPVVSRRITAFMLIAIGLVGLYITLRFSLRAKHHDEGGFTKAAMRRRTVLPLIGYVLLAMSGVGIVVGLQELMNWVIPAFCMLLGNAAGTSYELLVSIARHKQHARGPQGS